MAEQYPLVEIRQANYNPTELHSEVVRAIRTCIQFTNEWTEELDNRFNEDMAVTDRAIGWLSNEDDESPQWIEDEWRGIAMSFGISVFDDGEAGWTYVGFDSDPAFIAHTDTEE
jgi:hypothetical protein